MADITDRQPLLLKANGEPLELVVGADQTTRHTIRDGKGPHRDLTGATFVVKAKAIDAAGTPAITFTATEDPDQTVQSAGGNRGEFDLNVLSGTQLVAANIGTIHGDVKLEGEIIFAFTVELVDSDAD